MKYFQSLIVIITYFTIFPSIAMPSAVVAWGDSLTAGAGSTIPWPAYLSSISEYTAINQGIGGNTSTQIADRFLGKPSLFGETTVIWAGRNNYTDPSTVQLDIATMVSHLSTPDYLVLGIINGNYGGYESVGGVGYNFIDDLNNELEATYKNRFLDIRSILINSYNPYLPNDVINFENDVVPASLRADNIHLNSLGNEIVANSVLQYLTPVPLPAPFWLFGLTLLIISYLQHYKK